jgi:alkanesulfonate monooxygenase SsuD/methylene tetrahydromethanopterin reductase-like flavin-dependent oxidoreductase (luciferase family)
VRFAVGIPNHHEFGDPALVVELGRAAEAAGWDGVFLWDHMAAREPAIDALDPWVTLGALAAVTERVRLGALVTPIPRRRPWKLARETVTLDRLSGGRAIFGAGLGAAVDQEFGVFGEETDARVRADILDEGLEVLTALWSGEEVNHRGEHFTVGPTTFRPTPVQRPRIPVWVAGRWPNKRPFRRAAGWDGVFPTVEGLPWDQEVPPETLAEVVAYVREQREDDTPFDVVLECFSDGPGDTAQVAAYADAGLTWWIEKIGWFRGPLEEMRARVEAGPPRE